MDSWKRKADSGLWAANQLGLLLPAEPIVTEHLACAYARLQDWRDLAHLTASQLQLCCKARPIRSCARFWV
jgi:hypothetical protein